MNPIFFFLLAVVLAAAIVTGVIIYLLHRDTTPGEPEAYVAYTAPDYSDTAGFRLTSYPNNDVLIPRRYWLVNGGTAEVEYTVVPGKTANLRAAPVGTLKLPSEYVAEPYESVTSYPVDGVTVTQSQSPGRKAMLRWQKDGFDYAVLAPDPEMNTMGGTANDFITQTKAEKTA